MIHLSEECETEDIYILDESRRSMKDPSITYSVY